jgi:hypothetical protein
VQGVGDFGRAEIQVGMRLEVGQDHDAQLPGWQGRPSWRGVARCGGVRSGPGEAATRAHGVACCCSGCGGAVRLSHCSPVQSLCRYRHKLCYADERIMPCFALKPLRGKGFVVESAA